jgi:hypothetical protein
VLGHRIAEVGERVVLAVAVGGKSGAGGGEQIGEVPACLREKAGEPVEFGEHDRDVGDGGPDGGVRESLVGGDEARK